MAIPVYLTDQAPTLDESHAACRKCGAKLTVRTDSKGHRIVSHCVRCQEARKPK